MATIILVEENLETNMQTDRKRKNEIKPKNGHNTDIQNPIIKKEKKSKNTRTDTRTISQTINVMKKKQKNQMFNQTYINLNRS